jgi:hypothetical protein
MGRKWDEEGGVQVEADEGMYADDTQVLWGSRMFCLWSARKPRTQTPCSFGFPVFEPGDHQCSPVGWSLELGVFCNGSELTPEL